MRTVEAVALEHAGVIHALAADGTAVFPADDRYTPIWRVAAHTRRVIDFMLNTATLSDASDASNASAPKTRPVIIGTPGRDDSLMQDANDSSDDR